MSKYAISPEGAAAMEALAESLMLGISDILEASSALQQKYNALSDGLGIYGEEIHNIIQSNSNSIKTHKEDIVILAQAAKQKAQEINSLLSLDAESQGGAELISGKQELSGTDISPDRTIRAYSQGWSQQLSENQKAAIHDYTREHPPFYRNINSVLRGREAKFDVGNYERSELIHSALLQASTPCDLTLYRGGEDTILGALAFASDDELLYNSFQDKGFCSTSLAPGGAFYNKVLMIIHLPAGSHAANIEHLSAAGSYEQEVLIDKGCIFHVTDVYRDPSGRRVVEVFAENSVG